MSSPFSIVLLGGGLCNSVAVKVIHDFLLKDHSDQVKVTLVSAWDYTYYSAMFPGVLSGQYTENETRIALRPLSYACNTDFILGTAVRVDPNERLVYLQDGTSIAYDALSINVGSQTLGTGTVSGVTQWAILTRPMNIFLRKLIEEEERCKRENIVPKLLVVGSGASGVELITSIKIRLEKMFGQEIQATLIDKIPKVANSIASHFRKIIDQNLEKYKVKVVHNARVKSISAKGEVELHDGRYIHGEIIIWATGPEPQPLMTGLSTCSNGFIRVNQSLQSLDQVNIFAGGDCITMQGMPINFPPKTGVHAVQEGPVLALNLIAYVRARLFKIPLSLMLYEPMSDVLQLLNFGDGRGLATKYSMTYSGMWPFQLKNDNDLRLMSRFSPLRLLGETGWAKYIEVKDQANAREIVYAFRDRGSDAEWQNFVYDTEVRERDIEDEVRDLSPELAFDLLMESSDTIKQGSSEDYKFQFQIIKRADIDSRFRSEIIRYYKLTLDNMSIASQEPKTSTN